MCHRKPAEAPAVSAARMPASSRSSDRQITANVAAAIVQTPAASPSTPSVKFRTFITATIPISVSGAASEPRSTAPTNGSVKFSTVTFACTGTSAAANWPASLSRRGQLEDVVERADRRDDRGADQDPAHLLRVRQEQRARHEHADEDRETAEARGRHLVQVALAGLRHGAHARGDPGCQRCQDERHDGGHNERQ